MDQIENNMHPLHSSVLAIAVLSINACGGTGSSDVIPPDASDITADPSTFKLVFRTQTTSSDFARGKQQPATEVADGLCQSEADRAQLAGIYRAWLSDDLSSPDSRFLHSTTPYAKIVGLIGDSRLEVIAANWDELVSGRLRTKIDNDPYGATSIFDGPMWTGTLANGTSGGQSHCDNWTSKEGQSPAGSDASIDVQWTAGPVQSCMERGGLYCFQQ